MTYTITQNHQFNSLEIYFDGKPTEAVRTALKELRFRWHSVKRCWYGYCSEETAAAAITSASTEDEPATVYGDGYLGGGSVYGSKSSQHLYGAELSAAIRADIKKAGIKGVTVSCKRYTGGQTVTATLKTTPADYISESDYIAAYRIRGNQYWLELPGECIHADRYLEADADRQEEIRIAVARYAYQRYTTREQNMSPRNADWLTPETRQKLERIESIITAYRYDNSNGMVDYFDTNFYYDLCLKPTAA